MSDVKRYDMVGEFYPNIEELSDGDYVRFKDYERLERECAELRKKLEQAETLLLLSLLHHQGGHSNVGQPIRQFLGMGQFDRMTTEQVNRARTLPEPPL